MRKLLGVTVTPSAISTVGRVGGSISRFGAAGAVGRVTGRFSSSKRPASGGVWAIALNAQAEAQATATTLAVRFGVNSDRNSVGFLGMRSASVQLFQQGHQLSLGRYEILVLCQQPLQRLDRLLITAGIGQRQRLIVGLPHRSRVAA